MTKPPTEVMEPIHVCHLGKYYPPAPGGIETHVRTIARAQADLGLRVEVLCVNHHPGGTVAEADGSVDVRRVGRFGSVAKIDLCPELVRAVRRTRASILHLHVPNPTMILALLAARPRQPVVVTYHSDVVSQKVRAALFRPFERLAYRRVRRILPTSPVYQEGSPFLQAYRDRVTVLPLGIDLRPYLEPSPEAAARAATIRKEHGRGGPLWFSSGRFVYYKGFINSVRALAHVGGRLILIGDGPNQAELQDEARRLGVNDRIDFVGTLPHYLDLLPYYLAADAFWFPSNARSEAFGLVQVEAMASGCPVINTAIPHSGVPWVSPHNETGLTVPINDPKALAAAASRLLTEPGLRESLTAAARRRAVAEFDHRLMAERSLAVYRAVLANAAASTVAGRPVLVPSR